MQKVFYISFNSEAFEKLERQHFLVKDTSTGLYAFLLSYGNGAYFTVYAKEVDFSLLHEVEEIEEIEDFVF